MLRLVIERVQGRGGALNVTDEAIDKLAEIGFDPVYGARPLRRTIQSSVEDAVAEKLLEGSLKKGDNAEVRVQEGKIAITKQ
jgi:ATP-dependent Clp protease ATP-binding subunit ClpC